MSSTNASPPSEPTLLFVCKKCSGCLRSQVAYDAHIRSCDGDVSHSECTQFIRDKEAFVDSGSAQVRNTPKVKQVERTKTKSGRYKKSFQSVHEQAQNKRKISTRSHKVKVEEEDDIPSDEDSIEDSEDDSVVVTRNSPRRRIGGRRAVKQQSVQAGTGGEGDQCAKQIVRKLPRVSSNDSKLNNTGAANKRQKELAADEQQAERQGEGDEDPSDIRKWLKLDNTDEDRISHSKQVTVLSTMGGESMVELSGVASDNPQDNGRNLQLQRSISNRNRGTSPDGDVSHDSSLFRDLDNTSVDEFSDEDSNSSGIEFYEDDEITHNDDLDDDFDEGTISVEIVNGKIVTVAKKLSKASDTENNKMNCEGSFAEWRQADTGSPTLSEISCDQSHDISQDMYDIRNAAHKKKAKSKSKPRKERNFSAIAGPDQLTLQFLAKQKEKYKGLNSELLRDQYVEFYEEDKPLPDDSYGQRVKGEKPALPAYQCPRCPNRYKKVLSFHIHLTDVHGGLDSIRKQEESPPPKSEELEPLPSGANLLECEAAMLVDDYLMRQGKFRDPKRFDPSRQSSRQHYKHRREEWAAMYDKYAVDDGGRFSHYACPSCTYTSPIMGHFHRHISRIHTTGDKVDSKISHWPCPQCEFVTESKPKLKQHMLSHIRPFLCQYCPKRFGNKANLKDHIMKHEGVMPLKCPQCDYRARQKRCIIEHMRTHTGEFLKCRFCDFRTQYIAGLRLHELCKHQERNKHPCPYCEYVTDEKTSLLKHVQLHQECKDFMCGECTFTAATKFEVLKHMRNSHENFKMFFCDQCDYTSAYSTAFRNHIMLHYDLRPYCCSECDYAAPQKTRVEAHVKTRHQVGQVLLRTDQMPNFDLNYYKKRADKELAMTPRPRGAPRGITLEESLQQAGVGDMEIPATIPVTPNTPLTRQHGIDLTPKKAHKNKRDRDNEELTQEKGRSQSPELSSPPLPLPQPLLQLPMDNDFKFLDKKPLITVQKDIGNEMNIFKVDYNKVTDGEGKKNDGPAQEGQQLSSDNSQALSNAEQTLAKATPVLVNGEVGECGELIPTSQTLVHVHEGPGGIQAIQAPVVNFRGPDGTLVQMVPATPHPDGSLLPPFHVNPPPPLSGGTDPMVAPDSGSGAGAAPVDTGPIAGAAEGPIQQPTQPYPVSAGEYSGNPPIMYRYEITDPEGHTHLVELPHPLGPDENIMFVTDPQ